MQTHAHHICIQKVNICVYAYRLGLARKWGGACLVAANVGVVAALASILNLNVKLLIYRQLVTSASRAVCPGIIATTALQLLSYALTRTHTHKQRALTSTSACIKRTDIFTCHYKKVHCSALHLYKRYIRKSTNTPRALLHSRDTLAKRMISQRRAVARN